MAETAAGASLTAAHRTAQLQVQATALGRYARLWPLWTGDESSFEQLVSLAVPLVRVHYQLSSSIASAYYQAFRRAEGASGEATPRLAPALSPEAVTASLYVTGLVQTRKALAAGVAPEAAMRTALVRTSGAVGRHVVTGARATLIQSTAADRRARGYQRVTHAKACDFCRMLAGRGAVYSDSTADFRAHDHCACMAEPRYHENVSRETERVDKIDSPTDTKPMPKPKPKGSASAEVAAEAVTQWLAGESAEYPKRNAKGRFEIPNGKTYTSSSQALQAMFKLAGIKHPQMNP